MHLKFRVVADAHRGHEMSLSPHGLLKLELNFFLLPVVIDDVPHDFLLSLMKFVTGINVPHDEFFFRDQTIVINVNLVKYFVDNFI